MSDSVSAEQLRLHIEALERLNDEKAGISEDIRERFALAKSEGFEPKIIRQILKLRAMERHQLEEQDALLETYRHALNV